MESWVLGIHKILNLYYRTAETSLLFKFYKNIVSFEIIVLYSIMYYNFMKSCNKHYKWSIDHNFLLYVANQTYSILVTRFRFSIAFLYTLASYAIF